MKVKESLNVLGQACISSWKQSLAKHNKYLRLQKSNNIYQIIIILNRQMGCLNAQPKHNVIAQKQVNAYKNSKNKQNLIPLQTAQMRYQQQKYMQNKKLINQQIPKPIQHSNQITKKNQIDTKKIEIDEILRSDPTSKNINQSKFAKITLIDLNEMKKFDPEPTEIKVIQSIQTIQESPLTNLQKIQNNNIQEFNYQVGPLSQILQKQIIYSTIIQQNFDQGNNKGTRPFTLVDAKPISLSLDFKNELFTKKIEISPRMTDNIKNSYLKKSSSNKNKYRKTKTMKQLDQYDSPIISKPLVMKIAQYPRNSMQSSKKGIKIIKKEQSNLSIKKLNSNIYDVDQNRKRLLNHKLKFMKLLDNYTLYLKEKNKRIFGLVQFFKLPYKQLALYFIFENIINLKSINQKQIFQKIKQNLQSVIKYFLKEYQSHLANNNVLFMYEVKYEKDVESMISSIFNIKNSSLGIDQNFNYWKNIIICIDEFFLHY